ncbi:MAG: hypothetical protein WBV55_09450 [Candidatus Sulfotelmatobacter sp.]
MSIFRLLLLSLLILVIAATVAAQSAPNTTPFIAHSTEPAQFSSPSADSFSPNLQTGFKPNTTNPILLGDPRPTQSQFMVPRNWLRNNADWQSQTDGVCLKMRTYKVARDDPRSDSTHPAGYSTCQPAARFQTRAILYTLPSTP